MAVMLPGTIDNNVLCVWTVWGMEHAAQLHNLFVPHGTFQTDIAPKWISASRTFHAENLPLGTLRMARFIKSSAWDLPSKSSAWNLPYDFYYKALQFCPQSALAYLKKAVLLLVLSHKTFHTHLPNLCKFPGCTGVPEEGCPVQVPSRPCAQNLPHKFPQPSTHWKFRLCWST